MKRMIFICILIISLILISGCVSQTANPSSVTGPQPPAPGDPMVQSGRSSIALAFKTDEISTTSPEARDLFLNGLTSSTQYARYNDSLAFFDAALAIDRNFSEAWVAKGVALHNLGRYDEAINNYDRALALDPDDAGIWQVKAMTLRDWGKPNEAAACNQRAAALDPLGYPDHTGVGITTVQTPSCRGYLPPVPAGGDVWLGESCLNVSAGVSSGQVISWYNNGRNAGNAPPDASRIVYDSQNFSVNPDEFLGFEGNWYLGTTDTIAFVVRIPVLDTNSTSADSSVTPSP
jgi:tetratricopeptide (TPR) repeat protein